MSDTLTHKQLLAKRGAGAPRVFMHEGTPCASSEDVAAYFGKQHYNVLRDINILISTNKDCAPRFEITTREMMMPTGGKRETAIVYMDRDGFSLLAMGFTGARALAWKLKYIEAFNKMEQALLQPIPIKPAPNSPRKTATDQFNTGLDLILTAETALRARDWLGEYELAAITSTLEQARKSLLPVRQTVMAA